MAQDGKLMGIPQLLQFNTLIILATLFLAIVGSQILSTNMGGNNIIYSIIILLLALGLLVVSADFFIEGAKGLARRGGIPEVVIGLTIVSIGTSLPEILVTSTSALNVTENQEVADFAIGGILGSVLVQITLILGFVALVKGLKIRPSWLNRDGLIMMLSLLLMTFFLISDEGITRLEGIILSSLYIVYISWLLYNRKEIMDEESSGEAESIELRSLSWSGAAYFVMVLIGLALAVFAAHHLVVNASDLAYEMNIPHSIIGTVVSGLGTSLPELTIAFMAAKRSQGVAIGTLIGSNITDPLLSIGIAATVHPLYLTDAGSDMIMLVILPASIISTAVALLLMRTSYEFRKWEGIILIVLYFIFLAVCEYFRRVGF
ncbi:MAG: sodium/hydrogen exchanger [Candidatus Poseidoniales archaeon]|jgi:cation:H+ antiporter|nr:calcium/sodium antiporter [Candidatus Thermoplasmatota archaeon]GIQ97919.1 MAG: sodium/hydrogen exchanger [Candidatus Poseidoniales archaeon]|tara:strand:+ start:965 stop:2089 length:1125 start_codon:yes stop_codon:yes gene_type:complete